VESKREIEKKERAEVARLARRRGRLRVKRRRVP
jgi:hypothetical protein